MNTKFEIAAAKQDLLGEGPVYVKQEHTLRWTDILGRRWHCLDLSTGKTVSHDLPEGLTAFAPIAGSTEYIGALTSGIARLTETGKHLAWLSRPEADIPTNRFNDGGSDPAGRFLAGTMNEDDHAPTGNLYRLNPPDRIDRVLRDIGICNTIAFSPCGTRFYTADTATGALKAYRYDPDTGTIGDIIPEFNPPEDLPGYPDGSAVDEEGCLWNARWGGRCLVRLTSEGKLDRTLMLPVSQPTSCAFVGRDLYITSALVGLDEAQCKDEPDAGSLFRFDVGVAGVERPPLQAAFASSDSSNGNEESC